MSTDNPAPSPEAQPQTAVQPQQINPQNAPSERPAWLPMKFASPEQMAKSYAELEKRMATKPSFRVEATQPPSDPQQVATKAETTDTMDGAPKENASADPQQQQQQAAADKAANAAVERAGLDMAALHAEYQSGGKLTDASLARLEAIGIGRDVVAQYIAGLQATEQITTAKLLEPIGGQARFAELSEWAQGNLTKEELASYNASVSSGNHDTARMALLWLDATAKARTEPAFFATGEAPNVRGDVYRSTDELVKDMSDARYKSDPAFRADVERRLGRSSIL